MQMRRELRQKNTAGCLLFGVLLLLGQPASSHDAENDMLRIELAVSHAMIPGSVVGDGYLTISNPGQEADRLLLVRSPAARLVELHEMKVSGGVMDMRKVEGGLEIPGGKIIKMEPRYHLMFYDVAQPFKQGDLIKATAVFEHAGEMDIEFKVGRMVGSLEEDEASSDQVTSPMNSMLGSEQGMR